VCVCVYVYVCVHMCVFPALFSREVLWWYGVSEERERERESTEREREREREREKQRTHAPAALLCMGGECSTGSTAGERVLVPENFS
jgi:hypothetical protein